MRNIDKLIIYYLGKDGIDTRAKAEKHLSIFISPSGKKDVKAAISHSFSRLEKDKYVSKILLKDKNDAKKVFHYSLTKKGYLFLSSLVMNPNSNVPEPSYPSKKQIEHLMKNGINGLTKKEIKLRDLMLKRNEIEAEIQNLLLEYAEAYGINVLEQTKNDFVTNIALSYYPELNDKDPFNSKLFDYSNKTINVIKTAKKK